ncbi:capsule polysacchride export protein KpsC [Psychromonas sp. CNPT3]|uniref:capsular polysaccharide biosynthesis protein n=1 Tax=Psychromonas sp. CNPT3 TaxID=314282 RepID=UPI0002C0A819|nr:capsular polysaccharide biosynthesis protein [Psychromonas sp. CNPT3]AGH81037.1 capsule polysacchride export protein KpsC [Psychromonas sp. CNPT3]
MQNKNNIWTYSKGIEKGASLALFLESPIKKINRIHKIYPTDSIVGWGNKTNTHKAKLLAQKLKAQYIHLEDGFIGYLGHPNDNCKRLSLIQDKTGIYYDATKTNDLESLCLSVTHWISPELEMRAEKLRSKIIRFGISKYNHQRENLPAWLIDQDAHSAILVVDQTAGDMSVEYGLGTSQTFKNMIKDALRDHPKQLIIVKTHPDVIKGKKKGYLDIQDCTHPRVRLLAVDCSLKALFNKVERVYTVTSQLGFEGLLYHIPVHCYGLPFYAGWGLTQDKQICERRNICLTLNQLICASLIKYPTYLDPQRQKLCDVETIVDWLALQMGDQDKAVNICYAFGFSLWKRAFIKQFVGRMAKKIIFIKSKDKLINLVSKNKNVAVLVWGANHSSWIIKLKQSCSVWFIEDGFIRSIGLGADLCRPSSLVIDKQSMYYVPDRPSDIIDILNTIALTSEQTLRAKRLTKSVIKHALSKYNVGQKELNENTINTLDPLRKLSVSQQEIILVPGQFEQDQSIANSRGKIKSNLSLLQQVRIDHPDAFIIFKEHPDLYSGVRPGALGQKTAMTVANMYLSDVDISVVIDLCDRVCTLTSLTGFEALLRGKKVSTYGSPFYAGWGMTDDHLAFAERKSHLTLDQLVYSTLVLYPRYVDWTTGSLTSPERVIELLIKQREINDLKSKKGQSLNSPWHARFMRKLKYFYEASRF